VVFIYRSNKYAYCEAWIGAKKSNILPAVFKRAQLYSAIVSNEASRNPNLQHSDAAASKEY
jgi:hypothetical protein